MRNFKYIILILAVSLFVACDETESVTFDPVGGPLAIGFESSSSTISVASAGTTVSLDVISTVRTNEDRSIPVSIDPASTGAAADYTVGTINIPAGEHVGTLSVIFDNFDGMVDCENNTLILNIESGTDNSNGPEQYTFNYTREFDCPDLFLNIEFDDYPGETSWQVAQGETILLTGDGYDGSSPLNENLCLCPGEYVFTIFDAFGDGICCAYGDGSYEVVLNGTVLFTGGSFTDEMSHTFTVE